MSRDTGKSFFILSPLVNKYAALYQQLLGGVESYKELGNRIIREIKAAHAFRQIGKVRELSSILLNIPIQEFWLIAQYYLAWCDCRESNFNSRSLERLAGQTQTYKTKALLTRAAIEGYQGKIEPELYFYSEALKTTSTISDYVEASRCIAVVKAKEGFHRSAVNELENLIALIRYAEPLVYYDFLNSYATELAEEGRKQEARNISQIVLASPFIHAYPEWQETARDLRELDRSSVFIDSHSSVPQNVLLMPATRRGQSVPRYHEPARVLSMQKWKKKMGKDKKGNEGKPPEIPTKRQIINQILLFYTNKNTTDYQRYKLWEAAQKIMSESEPPETEPDDSEGA